MTDNELKLETQRLVNENKFEEAVSYIFDAYQQEHPNALNIQAYRDKVLFKIKTEFTENSPDQQKQVKLLIYAFMTIIGFSEGESAFNLVLLLLHLLHKGQDDILSEAIALIKLEKASQNLVNHQ